MCVIRADLLPWALVVIHPIGRARISDYGHLESQITRIPCVVVDALRTVHSNDHNFTRVLPEPRFELECVINKGAPDLLDKHHLAFHGLAARVCFESVRMSDIKRVVRVWVIVMDVDDRPLPGSPCIQDFGHVRG